MSYELFQKAAALNNEFEIIPSKTSIYAKGIIINNNGYMHYKGKTYIPNMVKLLDLPIELQKIFLEPKLPTPKEDNKNLPDGNNGNKNQKLEDLSTVLFEQLNNITKPKKDKDIDINLELKKANAVCNVADKIITIADLSLKAEMFYEKKKLGRSVYEGY